MMDIWIALKVLTLVLLVIAGGMTFRNAKKAERLFEEVDRGQTRPSQSSYGSGACNG